ncbi:MAG: transketolase [Clostridia bacterium]|nr:transketolase [Clostridia bacterium]
MNINYLQQKAAEIRLKVIEGVSSAASGHPGGSLSISDILAVLYFDKMNITPKNPGNPDRDRFVLSKGHAAPAYYGALALSGYFDENEIKKLRTIGSFLQGHPDMIKVPGVDMSTGSLGQGLSAATGMALYAKRRNKKFHVYAIIGDGEMQEGQIWESFMTSAHYSLDNLTVFIDLNGLQIDGEVKDIMNNNPVREKLTAFGWNTIVIDGHSIPEIGAAIDAAKETFGKPTAIICNTIKGKGVSYMENKVSWHGAAPDANLAELAMEELGQQLKKLREVG